MVNSWAKYAVATAFAVWAVPVLSFGVFGLVVTSIIMYRHKKSFVKAGKISKLFFFPVKSLKAVEVNHGRLTPLGFEVDGLLDRSFMLVDEENVLVSQSQSPSLVLLTPEVKDNYLVISGPNTEPLRVEILKSPPSNGKLITNIKIHEDVIDSIDCGEEAAAWFQEYLNKKGVRLVRFFPNFTIRKYNEYDPVFASIKKKKEHTVDFPDFATCHVVSQPSIDDLNSRLGEKKISVLNFRPNVLVDECNPYDEDSWKNMRFGSKALLELLELHPRCVMTTIDPETGVLSQKEPLVSLRKYRRPYDYPPLENADPCFGTCCAVSSPGNIKVGDQIFAVITYKPQMQEET